MGRFLSLLVLVLAVIGAGCSHVKPFVRATASDHTSLDPVGFEAVEDGVDTVAKVVTPKVSLRLDGVPLRQVIMMVSEQADALIVTPVALDETPVYGVFLEDSLETVLTVIAQRLGVRCAFSDGVWCLGTVSDSDLVSFVATVPPSDLNEFRIAAQGMYPQARVYTVGSVLWVREEYRVVRRISEDLLILRKKLSHAYIVEVFFVRISEEDFLEASVDLKVNSVDLFASSFQVEQLFKAITSGSAGVGSSSIESRPVVYLAESRPAKMSVGSEIIREERRTLENGASEVSGYQRFSDGLEMTLTLNRVSGVCG